MFVAKTSFYSLRFFFINCSDKKGNMFYFVFIIFIIYFYDRNLSSPVWKKSTHTNQHIHNNTLANLFYMQKESRRTNDGKSCFFIDHLYIDKYFLYIFLSLENIADLDGIFNE